MEVINIVSILLAHAVVYVALRVAPTRLRNRVHKVEQVGATDSDSDSISIPEPLRKKQHLGSASISKPQPAVGSFGKRYLQHSLQRGREPPRRVLYDDEDYAQASPTAADIWTIPSHVPKLKSARLLWYLNDFIPAHPDIDPSTVEGRQELRAIALEEEKGRKPARIHPVSAPKPALLPALTSVCTPVVHHLPPAETTTD